MNYDSERGGKAQHQPVMVEEVVHLLEPCKGGVFVDGTVGGGGHAVAIMAGLNPKFYVGIDRDEDALKIASGSLKIYGDNIVLVHASYGETDKVLDDFGIESVDAILLDLGLSSFQLEGEGRGFSFLRDEPLDMRMDRNQKVTAAHVVNTYSTGELERIFREYGEERWAKRIARNIVETRKKFSINTTGALAQVVGWSIPRKFHPKKMHPATKVFQALRIEVNRELEELEKGLNVGIGILGPKGRLLVISFHSLEDGMVKRIFKDWEADGKGLVLTKKPITPTPEEIEGNIRCRSAKLRAFEKS